MRLEWMYAQWKLNLIQILLLAVYVVLNTCNTHNRGRHGEISISILINSFKFIDH